MADKEQFKPGDCQITKITLYSDDGQRQADIRNQVRSIDIYESVMSPIMYCEISMNDSNDLLRQFPIITEEYVEIEYKLPASENPSKHKFHVKSIKNVNPNSQQKSKTYTIVCVSMEMVNNSKTRVDARFGGYRDKNNVLHGNEVHTDIERILKEYLQSEKTYEFEICKGIDELLVTRIQPFRAIDMLRRRAISKTYESSSFCFFENKRGYTLSTLERLFDKGKGVVGDKIFWTDTDTGNDVAQNMYRNILGYKQIHFADSIEKMNQGGFHNKVGSLDITTGKYTLTSYDDSKESDKFKSIEDTALGENSSFFTKKHANKTSKTLLMVAASDRAENFLPQKVSMLQAYTQKLMHSLVRVHVYGDDQITAGDVIECHFPTATGTTEKDHKEDRLQSGKFLVSKVRHILINSEGRQKYTMSFELIKGGLFEKA